MIFSYIVFTLLALLLFLATGAAIHLGVFRAGRQGITQFRKVTTAILSYGFSGIVWYLAYGHHYVGW